MKCLLYVVPGIIGILYLFCHLISKHPTLFYNVVLKQKIQMITWRLKNWDCPTRTGQENPEVSLGLSGPHTSLSPSTTRHKGNESAGKMPILSHH